MKTNYTAPEPTLTQIACNAIRDMFFNERYKGVIPVGDIEHLKVSKSWHRMYGKDEVCQALKELEEEEYMNLDEKKENYLWGLPGTHKDLF